MPRLSQFSISKVQCTLSFRGVVQVLTVLELRISPKKNVDRLNPSVHSLHIRSFYRPGLKGSPVKLPLS